MKITSVDIKNWRLLKDPQVLFQSTCSVIIGENGSGKSTLLELILCIFDECFRRLERPNYQGPPDLNGYRLCYDILREGMMHRVEIESGYYQDSKPMELHVRIDDRPFYFAVSPDFIRYYLPTNILVYYAGETDRLAIICNHYFENNAKTLANKGGDYTLKPLVLPTRSPLIFSDINHLSVALLSLLISSPNNSETLHKLGIEQASVTAIVHLKQPGWASKDKGSAELWGNKSQLIEDFIVGLFGKATQTTIEDKRISIEIDINGMKDFLSELGISKMGVFLFDMFEILRTNELLDNLQLQWYKRGDGPDADCISVDYFSEGEKQVILTSALVEFWDEEDCLFLFDEPDTFLHPRWQSVFLPEVLRHLKNSQVIITTHSPLMISTVTSECELFIMKDGDLKKIGFTTYGMEASDVIETAMNTPSRDNYVDELITKTENAISGKRLEEAKRIIKVLDGTGVNRFDLNRLRSTIEKFELLGI